MNEIRTAQPIDFEAQFASITSELGELAMLTQVQPASTEFPEVTPAELEQFISELEPWNSDSMFTDADKEFLEGIGVTTRGMEETELRALANRERAVQFAVQEGNRAAFAAQEQAAIGNNLRKLRRTTETDDEEEAEFARVA